MKCTTFFFRIIEIVGSSIYLQNDFTNVGFADFDFVILHPLIVFVLAADSDEVAHIELKSRSMKIVVLIVVFSSEIDYY